MRRNASFHVVAMDAVFSGDELASQLLHEIAELVEVAPSHRRPSVLSRLAASMRFSADGSGKHVGKVVVAFSEAFIARRAEPLAPSSQSSRTVLLDHRSIWLGRSSLGGSSKRRLVLASRSGAASPEAESFVEDLRARSARARGQGGRQLAFGRDATHGRDSRE